MERSEKQHAVHCMIGHRQMFGAALVKDESGLGVGLSVLLGLYRVGLQAQDMRALFYQRA